MSPPTMQLYYLSGLLVLGCFMLTGCETAQPLSIPYSTREQSVSDGLEAVRTHVADLRLWDALAGARQLGSIIAEAPDSVRGELRAEAYQRLAMLHFDHMVFVDSVDYYTRQAEPLVSATSTDLLRARQLLCRAYNGYENFTWTEMQLFASLGQQLLQRSDQTQSLLSVKLMVIEARAAKQAARNVADPALRQRLRTVAFNKLRRAIDVARALHSPWEAYAMEHYILLSIQLPGNGVSIPAMIDSLRLGGGGTSTEFSFKDRLLAYRYQFNNDTDSATYYYQKLLLAEPLFAGKRISEARFILKEYGLDRKDYLTATAHLRANMIRQRCCATTDQSDTLTDVQSCTRRVDCVHFVRAQAEIYRRWALAEPEAGYADLAFDYARAALMHYEPAYRGYREEAVLNKSRSLGDRLITVALATAAERETATGEERYREAMFQAMELGKTVLLTRELMQSSLMGESGENGESQQRLQEIEIELDRIKLDYVDRGELSLATLEYFSDLWSESDVLSTGINAAITALTESDDSSLQAVPSLGELQHDLTAGQAFIHFTETDSSLYVLYADTDSSFIYTLPRKYGLALIDTVMASLSQLRPDPGFSQISNELYRWLLGPIAHLLDQKEDLLIVPSVALSRLPFAALVTSLPADTLRHPPTYLIADHSIRYLDSWRSDRKIGRLPSVASAGQSPSVGAWTHPELQHYLAPLALSVIEHGDAGSRHYQGGECSAATFMADFGRYDWLHLGVHARGAADLLNRNYLYLNDRDSLNGIYIGRGTISARLVVLAACATAKGYQSRLEGTYSLRRSFHRAGVPDVIASTFEIPAQATAGILRVFYDELYGGASPATALARAQRRCAAGELNRRWVWPGYWAGLIAG